MDYLMNWTGPVNWSTWNASGHHVCSDQSIEEVTQVELLLLKTVVPVQYNINYFLN